MSRKPNASNLLSKWWQLWVKSDKFSAAFARGGTALRVGVLILSLSLISLCFLIFSTDLLSSSRVLFEGVQDLRLTRQPYTSTPTVTPTKKPSFTPTVTLTSTPTGTLPKPSKTPIVFTATFTVTSTPTKPVVPLGEQRDERVDYWRERLADSWLWRHLYAIFVGVAFATWLVVIYLRDVYGLRRLIRSAGLLTRITLMFRLGTLHVKAGNLVDENDYIVGRDWHLFDQDGKMVRKNGQPVTADSIRRTLRLLLVGIPARLIVDEDSCVVIEGHQKQSLVCGPTGGPVLLLGFSRLRRTIDLRSASIKFTVQQPTRDGILISAEDVEFTVSVRRAAKRTSGNPHSYDEQAIFDMVYRFWLDGDWLPEMTARISAALRQFIIKHPLETFRPYLANETAAEPDWDENPFANFVKEFNDPQWRRGIQIDWLGQGKWLLAGDVDLTEQLAEWKKSVDQLLELPTKLSTPPAVGEVDQAVIDLIHQVPLALIDQLMPPGKPIEESDERAVVDAYRMKLIEVLQLYEQHGQPPPAELLDVIKHLGGLIHRKIGGL